MSVHFGEAMAGRLQWYAAARLPRLVSKAAQETGCSSNAHYIRKVIIEAVARDLGMDVEEMLAEQPTKARNPILANPFAYGARSEEVR